MAEDKKESTQNPLVGKHVLFVVGDGLINGVVEAVFESSTKQSFATIRVDKSQNFIVNVNSITRIF